MTLLHLRYFKAVCEFHSVTKAADELFISRTAISRSINALEQELGIVLFTHTTTGLELTDDGKIIYERINEVLGRICAIEQVAQQLAEGPKRQIVNVGLTPFTSQRIFPDFYQKFHENYPTITLAATEKNNLEARALLAEGSIDVIFTTDICYDTVTPDMYVSDVVFNPTDPLFLQKARARGAKTLNGVGMMVQQGAINFTIWTGEEAPVDVMYEALSH